LTMPKKNNYLNKLSRVNIWLITVVAILIASVISWFMVSNMAVSKSFLNSEINTITNSLNHLNDANSNVVSFTGYQDNLINSLGNKTQSQIDSVNSSITDANNQIKQTNTNLSGLTTQVNGLQTQANTLQTQTGALQTQTDNLQTQTSGLATQTTQLNTQLTTVNQTVSSAQTALTALTTKVNGLPAGIQITPTVSSGTISLSIISTVAQTIAFNITFKPTADMPQLATMDTSLAALYTTPPVTLTAGSSVRGDYTLYWNTTDSLYHLGEITFLTMRTALAAGTTTRSITFATTGSYEIIITPEYITGTSTGSW
jgi:cell division protein FtsL